MPGRVLTLTYSHAEIRCLPPEWLGTWIRRSQWTSRTKAGWRVWDRSTGQVKGYEEHAGPVTKVVFNSDGRRLATVSLDTTCRVWDTTSGRTLGVLQGHVGGLHNVAYSPRGDRVLTAGEDGAALWNVAQFASKPVKVIPLPTEFEKVDNVAARHPDFPHASQSRFFPDSTDYEPTQIPPPHSQDWDVVDVASSRRGGFGGSDKGIVRWLNTGRKEQRIDSPPMVRPKWPGQGYTFCSASRDGTLRVFIVRLSRNEWAVAVCDKEGEVLHQWPGRTSTERVALSASGERLVVASKRQADESVKLWDVTIYDTQTGTPLHMVHQPGEELRRVQIDPAAKMLLLDMCNRVVVRDLASGKEVGELESDDPTMVRTIGFSPDGRYIAMTTKDWMSVRLYAADSLQRAGDFSCSYGVRWFEFSPDSERLLIGQAERLMSLWNVPTVMRMWTRRGYVEGGQFSADGARFLAHFDDQYISTLWDVEPGEVMCVVHMPNTRLQPIVIGSDSNSLRFTAPDGPLVWAQKP